MKKIHLITLFLIFIFNLSYANISVKNLGMANGLSCDYVSEMAKDKFGFIWVATEEGLNRFDGLGFFTLYKGNRGYGITGNELNCLLDDTTEPIMWIGTQRSGLNAYNYITGEFTYYLHDDNNANSISTNDVTDLKNAADGNIWVATYWQGINLFDKKSKRFIHYNTGNTKGLPDNSVWCVLDDGKGRLYVGHVRSGLSVINLRNHTAVNYRYMPGKPNSISGNDIRCIYRDRAGRIWIGTDHGLDLFNSEDGKFYHMTDNGKLNLRVFDIKELSDGKLWVATEQGGIAVIDYYTLSFAADGTLSAPVTYLVKGFGRISGNTVRSIIEDKYKNIWLGLYGEGVDFLTFRHTAFMQITYTPFTTPFSLTNKTVLGLCIDDKGNIYAGTNGEGINVFNPEKERVGTMLSDIGVTVQAAYRDSRGRLWFGSFNNGAYLYAGGSMRHVTAIGVNEDVRAFFEDGNGHMWISTSHGLYVTDSNGSKAIKHYNVPGNLVRAAMTDTRGNVWVGTFGNGLLLYSPGMKLIKSFKTENGFPSNTVNQIIADSDGSIWVCTAEGLVHFGKGSSRYTVYNKGNNLDNTHIRAAVQDRQGNIWVSTNKGISCKRKGEEVFLNWNYKENIPTGNFTSGCVAEGRDGTIYFGSNNGLCYFNPRYVLEPKISPQPAITRLTIYDAANKRDSIASVIGISHITLDYTQNTFTVGFSSQDFSIQDKVEFSYKLKSMQGDWVTTQQNEVTFHNVPPGKYKLQLRSRLHNQQWSKQIAEIIVEIDPPLWLTWWAKTIYAICAIAIVWFLIRLYNRDMRLRYLYEADKKNLDNEMKLNNERMTFYTNITHELRTPLTLIISPLEEIVADKSLRDATRKSIELVRKNAKRLNELVDKLLEFRKMDSGNRHLLVGRANIVAVIKEMWRKYSELNNNDKVDIVFNASQEIINVYFDREVIGIIIDNLISNAIKYTDSGRITMSVSLVKGNGNEDILEISVADTGYGISPQALPHIFERYYQERGPHQASGTGIGLALVKNMVALHEGTIDVQSKAGKGSTFTVRLKADNQYDKAQRRDTTETSQPETVTEDSGTEGNDGIKHKIMLIVEDNHDICQYIADSFSNEFSIVTAENGKDGLKAAFKYVPDIIISDIMMPYMSGTEMCRQLKTDIRTNHIPIILLTAKGSTESKEEGYESGADSFITKPFVRSLIASRVANLLRQRELLAQAYKAPAADCSAEDMNKKRQMLRNAMDKADRDFLNSIDGHIKKRISSDKIDINYLAECMNISASTLYRKMKSLTGLSANEYIRKFKMTYAEHLLLEGKFTIKEIGFMVGMSTVAYFRKCFKDEFGETPSEYLKRVKGTECNDAEQ